MVFRFLIDAMFYSPASCNSALTYVFMRSTVYSNNALMVMCFRFGIALHSTLIIVPVGSRKFSSLFIQFQFSQSKLNL